MKNKYNLLRTIERELKFGVVGIDVFMTLYVLWLILTNDSTWLVGILFGFTPFGVVQLYRAHELFNFCIWHKLMLIHTVMVYGCCVYQAYFGFSPEILPIARWIMFLFGVFCIIGLLLKKCHERIKRHSN